ncbi:2-amino-4-hydroxy-6-hydroxymethyldihydropteridine diphosphokinase [Gynuella sunshinyii]|uniref:2-amino-4-hydroxy-6-hydroxymethyldihydropteridine diphosphokinase n=1 Tax=Gynuella sunshinyii YC6258 TaxID=1445510 RepID=A0A0C5VUA7_9GAMM|nr:2-amino-4-hydroxy-6-hydroxymethyldihydropteridine diphosphokinase [Gynuella sunshinyii]AJQ96898.1 7,8-dihydro-6-hydroxymethylpterin-pyrophosphokinase [Gynuella sunshinyii YC6258]
MVRVYLSLGSNIDRYRHLTSGLNMLREHFGRLDLSPVYESAAVGFEGDDFLNLVVAVDVTIGCGELSRQLKAIEDLHGRDRSMARFSARTLDIDILTYGDVVGDIDGITLPRAEILTSAFVLKPLSDLAPTAIHPHSRISYADLWKSYDQSRQPLLQVAFNWP